jgi:hypothetical protein
MVASTLPADRHHGRDQDDRRPTPFHIPIVHDLHLAGHEAPALAVPSASPPSPLVTSLPGRVRPLRCVSPTEEGAPPPFPSPKRGDWEGASGGHGTASVRWIRRDAIPTWACAAATTPRFGALRTAFASCSMNCPSKIDLRRDRSGRATPSSLRRSARIGDARPPCADRHHRRQRHDRGEQFRRRSDRHLTADRQMSRRDSLNPGATGSHCPGRMRRPEQERGVSLGREPAALASVRMTLEDFDGL